MNDEVFGGKMEKISQPLVFPRVYQMSVSIWILLAAKEGPVFKWQVHSLQNCWSSNEFLGTLIFGYALSEEHPCFIYDYLNQFFH